MRWMDFLKNRFPHVFGAEPEESKTPPAAKERTFIMILPDGVERGLLGQIITRFETNGLKLVVMKHCSPGRANIELQYNYLANEPFFGSLVDYASSGPICCMIWEGDQAVATGREMLGSTEPFQSEPGNNHGDFFVDVGRIIYHGSASVESSNVEIAHWFPEQEQIT